MLFKDRSMRSVLVALVGLASLVGLSGCTSWGVATYSDSLLARDGDFGTSSISEQFQGQQIPVAMAILNNAAPDSLVTMYSAQWFAQVGTTMGGVNVNSQLANIGTPKTQIATHTLFSFGTNNANYYAFNTPGSVDGNAARLYALSLMEKAYQAKSQCVIWVLGNPTRYDGASYGPSQALRNAFPGTAWRTGNTASLIYTTYMSGFNGWLRSLGGDIVLPSGARGRLRLIDWASLVQSNPAAYTMTDKVHPNLTGAQWLGREIWSKANSC